MVSVYCNLHDLVNRRKGMDGTEPPTFDAFLHFTLENSATHISQGLSVLQQYVNIMHVFGYDANDNR